MISNRDQGPEPGLATDGVVGRYARLAQRLLERRRARRALLPPGLPEDHAWALLLHLLAHRFDPDQTTAEALAAASDLSMAALIRWLALLQAKGLVEPCAGGWALSSDFLTKMIAHLRDHYPEPA